MRRFTGAKPPRVHRPEAQVPYGQRRQSSRAGSVDVLLAGGEDQVVLADRDPIIVHRAAVSRAQVEPEGEIPQAPIVRGGVIGEKVDSLAVFRRARQG